MERMQEITKFLSDCHLFICIEMECLIIKLDHDDACKQCIFESISSSLQLLFPETTSYTLWKAVLNCFGKADARVMYQLALCNLKSLRYQDDESVAEHPMNFDLKYQSILFQKLTFNDEDYKGIIVASFPPSWLAIQLWIYQLKNFNASL